MQKKPLILLGGARTLIIIALIVPVVYGFLSLAMHFLSIPRITSASDLYHASLYNFTWLYGICAAIAVLLVLLCRKYIDKKSLKSIGLKWKGYQNHAGAGFFTGIFIVGLGALILVALNYLYFPDINMEPGNLGLGFILFAIIAFLEELIFRGYLLGNLMESFPARVALIISSLLFALFHSTNPESGFIPLLNLFAVGLLFGINFIYTKNLWFSIFLHFSWNFFQGSILGFKVSGFNTGGLLVPFLDGPDWITGGGFGFEGSIVSLLLSVLVLIWIVFRYKKSMKVEPEVV